MECEKCGKTIEISERKFCSGCGAPISEDSYRIAMGRKPLEKSAMPRGIRRIAGDAQVTALSKALLLGLSIGFVGGIALSKLVFHIGVGGGSFFCFLLAAFCGLLCIKYVAGLDDAGKNVFSKRFFFIPALSVVYNLVEFLSSQIDFLMPSEKKNKF